MSDSALRRELQVGGAVRPDQLYIVRRTDYELLRALQDGEYCNVICPRQMGKTSAIFRIRAKLLSEGYRTAYIEIPGDLGTPANPEGWYLGLLREFSKQFQLGCDVRTWWEASPEPTANQKLLGFFRDEMLSRVSDRFVVFLDEIDSLTPKRGMGMSDSGVSERVISQLLTEMDGITTLQDIVVIAATNRPDMVDSAVLRPGRFDRLIYVPEPDEKSRLQILKIYTKGMPICKDVDLTQLTTATKYYSGADIESLCREAAMHALRKNVNSTEVTMKDFQDALKEMGPSISPDMEKWYKSFMLQIRQVQKPQTPVA